MKKLTLILLFVILVTPVFAAPTANQVVELKKIIANRKEIKTTEVEAKLQQDAIDNAYKVEIDEIITRIRRKRISAAKSYQPTNAEILVELKKRSSAKQP